MAILSKILRSGDHISVRDEQGVHTRIAPRYKLSQKASCLVRNKNMRFLCFEMSMTDVSREGLGLYDASQASFEYKVGDILYVTLDLTSRVFPRPIWAVYEVRGVFKNDKGGKIYGLKLISVDPMHQVPYQKGLEQVKISSTQV